MMTLTRRGEYAVRAVILLARVPPGEVALVKDLSEEAGAPAPFVAKILQSFARVGLVRSFRGAKGGFSLARDPSLVTLLEVVEAVEGPIVPNRCLAGVGACARERECAVHPVWESVRRGVRSILGSVTVEDLAKGRKAGPHAGATGTRNSGGMAPQGGEIRKTRPRR